MIQKKLQPHLEPEPNSDESGELDSVYERNFVVKSADDAKAVVDMMRANVDDFSSEFKLLTIAAFRNACLRNKELSKEIMEAESSENVVGVKVMDIWNHQATKNLEHLASTVDGAEKRWFHATTAAFIVMEYLEFIWDHLQTEKKEQLVDKKNHLNALHEEHGLEWNQRSYLDDVSATHATCLSLEQTPFLHICLVILYFCARRSRNAEVPLELMQS